MATTPPPGCDEAKTNIDWVIFRDSGARETFNGRIRQGDSAYDAVIYAQGHNSHAQQTIQVCHTWAKKYLSELGF